MNILEKKLQELKRSHKKAFVAFITAGFPSLRETEKIVSILVDNGVDIIELGVPFSDPMADGPTIQKSSEQALSNGVTLKSVLSLAQRISRRYPKLPIVLMSYANPLVYPGIENTFSRAKRSGVSGFIIPDTIPEESGMFQKIARKHRLSLIPMVAPNTPKKRMRLIDRVASGFVYVVSVAGVTGKRSALPAETASFLRETKRSITGHLRFLGFGISGPKQVHQYRQYVDGIIVGSALVDIVSAHTKNTEREKKLALFCRSIKNSLDK